MIGTDDQKVKMISFHEQRESQITMKTTRMRRIVTPGREGVGVASSTSGGGRDYHQRHSLLVGLKEQQQQQQQRRRQRQSVGGRSVQQQLVLTILCTVVLLLLGGGGGGGGGRVVVSDVDALTMMTMTTSSTLPTKRTNGKTLITFDVDGTLVKGSGSAADNSAHARSFSHAVETILLNSNGNGTTKIPPVAKVLTKPGEFHGSTDGLILLRLISSTIGLDSSAQQKNYLSYLPQLMECMYQYIQQLDDVEVGNGIEPLPGVIDTLTLLATNKELSQNVICGLVTGNVEGIARRKMKAVGIYQTGALSQPHIEQLVEQVDQDEEVEEKEIVKEKWIGTQDISFLGGFGSDYCSGNLIDTKRNYLDRAVQIAIATKRCQENIKLLLQQEQEEQLSGSNSNSESILQRVVHVGDAPADVLAAKAFAMDEVLHDTTTTSTDKNDSDSYYRRPSNICVGMVAVATGRYSEEELTKLIGDPIPGQWEPVVVPQGLIDSKQFLQACGVL